MSARMGFIQVVLISVAVLVLGPVAGGNVLYVNGECGDDGWSGLDPNCAAPDGPKATIQAAIDAAGVDDTIIVAPYRYYQNINFNGKQIVLRSTDLQDPNVVAATVIDGSYRGVTFSGDETPETVLTGFTVRGGIEGAMSQATIAHCVILGAGVLRCNGPIVDCVVSGSNGRGLRDCDGPITRCTITGNTGVGLEDCDGPITACVVTGTDESSHYSGGGGMAGCDSSITGCVVSGNYRYGLWGCDGAITHCTIRGNRTPSVSESYELYDCGGSISNCIVWPHDSLPDDYGGTIAPGCSVPTFSCIRDWARGGEGNIIADPGLADVDLRIAQPMARGYWGQDGIYEPSAEQVTFFSCCRTNWAPNELVGKLLNPDVTQPLEFVVANNTEGTITVWADNDTIRAGSSWVAAWASYALYDYHLQPDSPCINRGDPHGDYAELADIDGDDRVVHGRVDIGADEYTGPPMPLRPALVATQPLPNSTLPKTANNVLRLTFDMPIELPGGNPLSIVDLHDSICVSSVFGYALDEDGYTLKAWERGTALTNRTWYRVASTVGLNAHLLAVDFCTFFGDADGGAWTSPFVSREDHSVVKEHLGERTDARYDLDGNGRVTTADYGVVKAHLGERRPDKP